MKPEFANIFVVSSNPSRKEVVLTFFYEYPEFTEAGFARAQDDRNLNVNKMQRVPISSVVLNAEAAHHLGLTLVNSVQEPAQNPGMQNN